MKWQTLALTFLTSTGLASPITQRDPAKVYALRLVSKTPSLNGKYLGAKGQAVGVYKDPAQAVKFFPVPSTEGLYELHRYPSVGQDEQHALALVGAESHGLLDLADLVNPAATEFPKGTKVDWNSFTLDKESKSVEYAGAAGGRWAAFPSGNNGEWSVKWKDPSAITIDVYMPVTVVYEEVE
ncbi:hypothetical protein QBC37DRAFT_479579 [Rhypophila decipiens]|uniref:Uncharacterized protein n=1 Tax=Rhypophila decipiens TaxID=261697 RepID=A0AAN6YE58_9PEZI|nr:hypothetical protein QBC37DRAFT_479579 [Rhypophila decipiens]